MGSCVCRSGAIATAAAAEPVHALTANVVGRPPRLPGAVRGARYGERGPGRVATAGVTSRDRSEAGAAVGDKRRRRQDAWRVAPLVAVSTRGGGEWKGYRAHGGYDDAAKAESGDRTVGKTRRGDDRKGVARRLAAVQRLSAIAEAASE